jgi:hypothetical protein
MDDRRRNLTAAIAALMAVDQNSPPDSDLIDCLLCLVGLRLARQTDNRVAESNFLRCSVFIDADQVGQEFQ